MVLKISDLAVCAEVSQHMVSDYGNHGLLGPVFRAKNNNYRSYDPRQIPQFYVIKTLRRLGYSLPQVIEYGQNRTPELAIELFSRCSTKLQEEITALQTQLDILQSHVSLIKEGQSVQPGSIEMRSLAERPIHRSSLEHLDGKRKDLDRLRRAHGEIRQNGNAGCPLGFAYNDFFDLLETPSQPAQLISFDPQGSEVRPAGEYLVGTAVCCYGEEKILADLMFDYVLQNNLEFSGQAYVAYLWDAASVAEPEQYLLQVTVKVNRMQ